MYLVRNVRDPIPARLPRSRVAAFAERVRLGLAIEPGAGVARAFERLGGTYLQVASTFGRRTDRIVVGAEGAPLAYEDEVDGDVLALGLAEALGALFLHHPLVLAAHGADAVTAVRRFTPPGDAEVVRDEALWFGIELSMPRAAFGAAYAEDPDPRALSRRFRVPRDSAERRARALGLGAEAAAA